MATKDIDAGPRGSIFKNVPFTRITMLAMLILVFVGISFICSSYRDEGTLGEGLIRNFFADMFIIYQYPAVVLFYHTSFYNWSTYVLGLIIDAYLYAIVIRLIVKLILKLRKPKEAEDISVK